MLSAFVEERHDDVDSACFTGAGQNDTFQVLIVIIRAHMVLLAKHLICAGEIGDVADNKQVVTTYRTLDHGFSFAG